MLKTAVIGLGVGEAHLKAYDEHPQCDVVAVCDFNDNKLAQIKEKFPKIKMYEDAKEMLTREKIDVLTIASYDNAHYQQIILALEKNIHLFVEKPLCQFLRQAQDIRKILNNKPHIKISSNLILRQYPRFLQLKQQIDSGAFGEFFYCEGDYNYGRVHKIIEGWRGDVPDYSVMLGGGIHLIDLMMWLTQKKVEEVFAYGNKIATRNSKFKYYDFVLSTLRCEDGTIAKVTANFGCVYPHFHKLNLYGTKATFENHFNHANVYYSRDQEVAPQCIATPYPGVAKGGLIANFIESILTDKEPEIGREQVFSALSICFAIDKSLQSGKPEPVKYV